MTEPVKPQEGVQPNPAQEEQPKPPVKPNPEDGTDNPNLQKELDALKEKHETLKRQYSASTEEALRLKDKIDELEAAVATLQKSASDESVPQNDEAFNQLVAKVGLAEAVRRIAQAEVKPVAEKTDVLFSKNVDGVLEKFKTDHPGLKGDVLTKFDTEFDRLKNVYGTVQEAMEAAYAVVGGRNADAGTTTEQQDEAKRQAAERQAEEDKARAASNVSGGSGDRVPTPVDANAEVTAQIENLRADAIEADAQGRDSLHLWTQHEELKAKLASKSV